jgi:hypothetical protein
MSRVLVSLCGVKWAMEIIGRDNYHKVKAYMENSFFQGQWVFRFDGLKLFVRLSWMNLLKSSYGEIDVFTSRLCGYVTKNKRSCETQLWQYLIIH